MIKIWNRCEWYNEKNIINTIFVMMMYLSEKFFHLIKKIHLALCSTLLFLKLTEQWILWIRMIDRQNKYQTGNENKILLVQFWVWWCKHPKNCIGKIKNKPLTTMFPAIISDLKNNETYDIEQWKTEIKINDKIETKYYE